MTLGVSNIAWLKEERMSAYSLMEGAGLTGLEIAPRLFFAEADDPFNPDNPSAAAALAEIKAHGLSLVSMQSLLFGVHGASLFGDEVAQEAFEHGMNRAIELANRFEIPNLVFGSPIQRRIPISMPYGEAIERAVEVFYRLGDQAAQAGTFISIEPNPMSYGTNFLNTLEEVESFVALVNNRAVGWVLDLGAMHMNNASGTVLARITTKPALLHHVHISEPELAPAPNDPKHLAPILAGLLAAKYKCAVSIEMKRHDSGLNILRSRIDALISAFETGLQNDFN